MKKAQVSEVVVKWVILLALLAVLLWFIYHYIVVGVGRGGVEPLVKNATRGASDINIFPK